MLRVSAGAGVSGVLCMPAGAGVLSGAGFCVQPLSFPLRTCCESVLLVQVGRTGVSSLLCQTEAGALGPRSSQGLITLGVKESSSWA